MATFFLDLKDKPRVIDFLLDAAPFGGAAALREAEETAHAYHHGEKVHTNDLAAQAQRVAIESWAARSALASYCAGVGAEDEWKRLVAALRPTTARHLVSVRKQADMKTYGDVMANEEARGEFSDDELYEIEEVHKAVRQEMWEDVKEKLRSDVVATEKQQEEYQSRLKRLSGFLTKFGADMQEEIRSKVAHYEDRIFFAGEQVPLEILDGEIKYYTDQKEIRPQDT